MKTSANITVNGQTRAIHLDEGLDLDWFTTMSEDKQNFILRLASSQAFIAFGKRFAEAKMKEFKIPYSDVEFPATMSAFIEWGMTATRGASPTKTALDAAQSSLDKLEAEMSHYVIASDLTNPRLAAIGAELTAAKAAVDTAKAAHEAAEAAKPKKPKAEKAKPVDAMTQEELAAELAKLEAEAAEVAQH